MFRMADRRKKSNRHAKRQERLDPGNAFLPDPSGGPAVAPDDLAEVLAENFVASATTGEEQGEVAHEQVVDEELGGPFVQSSAAEEFGKDPDASNPKDAEPAPFPAAVSHPRP